MSKDWRNIRNGKPIPREQYTDQPYVAVADDGTWVCVLTTASGHEGSAGEHIGITRSKDMGESWTPLYFLEASDTPESAYGVLLKIPNGRIYCFYNFNKDNVREVICRSEHLNHRVDMQGYLVFRYSDDCGVTWSDRYEIPVRESKIDRENPYGGKLRMFWTVSKPFIRQGTGYVVIHKIGDMLTISEGWMVACENICTETDPKKLRWQTLPDSDVGLITPFGGGLIAEEQSMCVLSDGSIYCVYRSIDGHPVDCYSRDGGHTWEQPKYKQYDDLRLFRHPRAANFVWKCENGRYLYWYHNNGGRTYVNRNPVFVSMGIEGDSEKGKYIRWSQPEILLYDDDPHIRMSYPDLIQDKGRFFITETQKVDARVHEIPKVFVDKLWEQFDIDEKCDRELVGESVGDTYMVMPKLQMLSMADSSLSAFATVNKETGFTLEFWLHMEDRNQILFDSRKDGKGILVEEMKYGTVRIFINDGLSEASWTCDEGMLKGEGIHHIAIIADGAARIISYIIDGKYNDGGTQREFGFGRFSPYFRDVNGNDTAVISRSVRRLRIYGTALMTTEVIGNGRYFGKFMK
ncbi:MAG: sialidase family protein [Clostridia bacterium]